MTAIREARAAAHITGGDTAEVLKKLPAVQGRFHKELGWIEQYMIAYSGDSRLDLDAPVTVGMPKSMVEKEKRRRHTPSFKAKEAAETEAVLEQAAKEAPNSAQEGPSAAATGAEPPKESVFLDLVDDSEGASSPEKAPAEPRAPKATKTPRPKKQRKTDDSGSGSGTHRIPRNCSKDLTGYLKIAGAAAEGHKSDISATVKCLERGNEIKVNMLKMQMAAQERKNAVSCDQMAQKYFEMMLNFADKMSAERMADVERKIKQAETEANAHRQKADELQKEAEIGCNTAAQEPSSDEQQMLVPVAEQQVPASQQQATDALHAGDPGETNDRSAGVDQETLRNEPR